MVSKGTLKQTSIDCRTILRQAMLLNETDGELYAVATVNLCHPLQSESMAFLDENNLPGIGKWIEDNHLGMRMGVFAASGFCSYPLYTLF